MVGPFEFDNCFRMTTARRWLLLLVLTFAVLLLGIGAYLDLSAQSFSPETIFQMSIPPNWSTSHVNDDVMTNAPNSATPLKPSLRFLPPNESKRILFVSYPGSGNTWVRHLIEAGTRVYTGSVYSDATLFKDFRGENVSDTSVIAIKDHNPCDDCDTYTKALTSEQKKKFRSARVCKFCLAIRYRYSGRMYNVSNVKPGFVLHLIRNPFPSIVAYYQFWFVFLSHWDVFCFSL